MTILYGIPNCDTVKAARQWLSEQQIEYIFSDFKKQPPTAETLTLWLQHIPLSQLLNKRGTTWRKLTAEQQLQAAETAGAVALMAAQPSLIKRPVLAHNGRYHCGFTAEDYLRIFQAA